MSIFAASITKSVLHTKATTLITLMRERIVVPMIARLEEQVMFFRYLIFDPITIVSSFVTVLKKESYDRVHVTVESGSSIKDYIQVF